MSHLCLPHAVLYALSISVFPIHTYTPCSIVSVRSCAMLLSLRLRDFYLIPEPPSVMDEEPPPLPPTHTSRHKHTRTHTRY